MPIPVCPKCGSKHLHAFGRDESSRYARETVYHAVQCECRHVFTAALVRPVKPKLVPAGK